MDELPGADAAPWAARGSMFSQPGLARPVAWDTPGDLDRLRASHAGGRPGKPLVPASAASPLMANDVDLSDIVFKALIARRELLQRSTAARAVEIVGGARSAAALALRTYAARQRLIHFWFDAGTPAGRAMMESSGLTQDDLPAVVLPGATLKRTTPGGLAEKLGLSYRRSSTRPADATIVGAGPARLAAAVYGASEGLDTVLLDAVGTCGAGAAPLPDPDLPRLPVGP